MKLTKIVVCLAIVLAMLPVSFSASPARAYVGWAGAAGSPFIDSALPQPADVNVSRNTATSLYKSMVLDGKGYPCVAWQDSTPGNYIIMFARWNGTTWVNAAGTPAAGLNTMVTVSSSNAEQPSLKLDSKGNPNIVWSETYIGGSPPEVVAQIGFAKWNGAGWVNINGAPVMPTNCFVTNCYGRCLAPDLQLDSSDRPNIVWFCDWMPPANASLLGRHVCFSKWDGAKWADITGAALTEDNSIIRRNAFEPRLALDASQRPMIIWSGSTSTPGLNIGFQKWDGTQWVTITGQSIAATDPGVTSNSAGAYDPSLAINKSGNPCISWYDNTSAGVTNSEICYCYWNGSAWVNAAGVSLTLSNAIVLNAPAREFNPWVAINSSNNPCIVWVNNSSAMMDLVFTQWNGSMWTNISGDPLTLNNGMITPNHAYQNEYPVLCMDSRDLPNIVFDTKIGVSDYEVYYIHFMVNYDSSFKLTKSVAINNSTSFTGAGKTVNEGDKLTYKLNWQFQQGNDPFQNPYLYDTIPEGTTYVAGSVSPTANVSYSLDNGTTWTAGEPPNGSPAGTKLRWNLASLWTGASGNLYVGGTANQPSDINVSSLSTMRSEYSSVRIDSYGNPCIAWERYDGHYSVCFVKWNGTAWVNAAGDVYNNANACIFNGSFLWSYPTLELDSANNPGICWFDVATREVFFARWNGTAWVNAAGANLTLTNGQVSVSGGQVFTSKPSFAFDPVDRPCITWERYDIIGNEDIDFTRWNGSRWVNAAGLTLTATNGNVSNNTSLSAQPDIAIDSFGYPNICWDDSPPVGNREIFFARWNGTNWVNASGVALTPTNGNISNNSGFSANASIDLDSSNRPNIVWEDNTSGFYSIYYAKWNGSSWVNASGTILSGSNASITNTADVRQPVVIVDSADHPCIACAETLASNKIVYIKWNGSNWVNAAGATLTNTNRVISSNMTFGMTPALSLNSAGLPFITWTDFLSVHPNDIFFAKWTNDLSFQFSVKVNDPCSLSSICNQASFRHAWDMGTPVVSNSACVNVHSKTPILEVTKTAGSSNYNIDDTFDFTITVKNTGDATATNVIVTDNFPNELEFVSSVPAGTLGISGVRYSISNLAPGGKETFKLKFKLGSKVTVEDSISIINEAVATVGTITARDSAVIKISTYKAPGQMSLDIKWLGLTGNEGKTNDPVKAIIRPEGGTSPYDVSIDWGDSSKSSGVVKDTTNDLTLEHSYQASGNYTITLICRDRYLQTRTLTKAISIK